MLPSYDTSLLQQTVIFGYGVQGAAQAANLEASSTRATVWVRPESTHISEIHQAGLPYLTDVEEAAKRATIAVILIPDAAQPDFYRDSLAPHLPVGAALIFAHGFAIHTRQIAARPDLDVVLVAPLAHGEMLQRDFVERGGVPCVLATAQDATGRARERACAYATAIAGRGPFIDSTFAEEVESDLFAEQAVLCGGMPELVRAAFETLVSEGVNEEIAYCSCLAELRALANLMEKHGIAGMRDRVSDTARYGAITRGPRVIDGHVRDELHRIFTEIRSGDFAREWIAEQGRGSKDLAKAMQLDHRHAIESLHRKFHP
jgi:ketol-acid reductoisomerase